MSSRLLTKDNPVRARIRSGLEDDLRRGQPPIAVLHRARRDIQGFAGAIFARSGAPVCAAGCSHCCENVHVGVNATEARELAEHVRRMPAEQARVVRERFATNAARVRAAPDGAGPPGVRCALLGEDKRCLAYDVRPLTCRRAHSYDAEACKKAAAGEAAGIPMDARVFGMYAEVSTAFREAVGGKGGDAESYDLSLALDRLLADPEADLADARERHDERAHQDAIKSINLALSRR